MISTDLHLPSTGDLLRAKNAQNTNRVIAATLSIIEEVADDHDAALDKLRSALPAEYKAYVDLAAPMTEARFDALRARVLKVANDSRRDLEETIQTLRIE